MEHSNIDLSHLAKRLNGNFKRLDLSQRLELIGGLANHAVFTTSLGLEDQVLTWAIAMSKQPIEVATLQTGRLFPESLSLLSDTKDRYQIDIKEYYPEPEALKDYVATHGQDGFYDSVEARKACCNVRKLKPLAAALRYADVWVTGLRREQSLDRSSIEFVEWDDDRGLLKVNPLADWTEVQIKEAVAANQIPINPLHERGFPSIGCAPCTRAIRPGESERAGRWWWEQQDTRECGLHVGGDGGERGESSERGESGEAVSSLHEAVQPEGEIHSHA
ncbi:MAG: phosphoadenylyl-sulfate reductase [Rhizobiaceae bacterium]|nr:phosphoadenylyl-sulfate reductase [Rhizobiaceae bacterium]